MGRYFVVWSGGADSTALLTYYAKSSSENYPIVAFSIESHCQLSERQLYIQNTAQKRYLEFARLKGWHIEHIKVKFGSVGLSVETVEDGRSVQPLWWLTYIAPYIKDGDKVAFGYIKQDGIWHHKQEFVDAFNALMRLRGVDAELRFPYEFNTKKQILEYLKENGVSNTCWATCEHPRKNYKPCGKCHKCKELRSGK